MTDLETKTRIRDFYDALSPHFRDLWGEHLHDGLYSSEAKSKEAAQEKLVEYLAAEAQLPYGARGLDIGCGMGATSVWLAKNLHAQMTGITLSSVQVQIAQELAKREGVAAEFKVADADAVQFSGKFDFLWMVGVLGHLPDQESFICNSPRLIENGGVFVLADWVIAEDVSLEDYDKYVQPVIDGMLMPEIKSLKNYWDWFERSGYSVRMINDLTKETRRTWDEGISITQTVSIVKLAFDLGRDALGLLSAIKGMGDAMDRGLIRYGVVIADKIE
ncbi:MAG: methyltransferase domain-containing protein [Verrucomicrobiota bacterium]